MAIPFDPDDDDGFEFVDEESDFGGAESEFPGAESDFGDDESAMVCGCFFQFLCQRKLNQRKCNWSRCGEARSLASNQSLQERSGQQGMLVVHLEGQRQMRV
ncbi:hypothetical protein P8452_43019 [Trifolium repens]|nr:hypothetical protein P8452_43019 [Trifolium repens]